MKVDMKNTNNKKGIIIFIAILAAVLILAIVIGFISSGSKKNKGGNGADVMTFSHDYIGKIFVEGTIEEDTQGGFMSSPSSYRHRWTIEQIEAMILDDHNKGILLYVNSPGGTVSASDELYLKLNEYKEKTNRPVYAYFGNMAASGGYYISANADRIIANRNCWTGSIGVTIGSIYDATQLLENLGIRSVTITSGANKAMGSPSSKLTDEQIKIFQGLVDDAYIQFAEIVSSGRDIPMDVLKPIADGRIYTAKQAKDLNLVDDIMTIEEAEDAMRKAVKSKNVVVEELKIEEEKSLLSILNSSSKVSEKSQLGGLEAIGQNLTTLFQDQGKLRISYMSEIQK